MNTQNMVRHSVRGLLLLGLVGLSGPTRVLAASGRSTLVEALVSRRQEVQATDLAQCRQRLNERAHAIQSLDPDHDGDAGKAGHDPDDRQTFARIPCRGRKVTQAPRCVVHKPVPVKKPSAGIPSSQINLNTAYDASLIARETRLESTFAKIQSRPTQTPGSQRALAQTAHSILNNQSLITQQQKLIQSQVSRLEVQLANLESRQPRNAVQARALLLAEQQIRQQEAASITQYGQLERVSASPSSPNAALNALGL